MKKKGISLIVLIITIVVIIILAASIILNLSKTNIIGNANTAVLKSDIATLQSELDLYVSDRFVDEKGKYERKKLNADQGTAMYGTENVEDKNSDGSVNIYDILTSLEKSKYKNNVYIQEGKLVFKNSGLKDEEVEVILEMGYEVDGMPKVTSISTDSTLTSIEVTLNVTLAEEVEKYVYILNDGQREESTELTKTYTGLTPGVNYTLEVILVLKDGTEISKKEIISTKDIDRKVTITKNPEIANGKYTNQDVKVTLSYENTIPEGYELQYKTSEIDWTKYTDELTITKNTTIYARLYNTTLEDEKASNSSTIAGIDKEGPSIPTTLNLSPTETSITAQASGSIDSQVGNVTYEYSIDNTTWQESGEFTNLQGSKEYTIYARAKDGLGNVSETKQENITTLTPDTTAPTASITVENVTNEPKLSVTVTASDESGILKIMYYYKKSTETEYTLATKLTLNGEKEIEKNFVIVDLTSATTYDVYAQVYDTKENNVSTDVVTIKTPRVYEIVFDNTNGTENTTINGEEATYNNPIVPVGFMAVNTSDAKWTEENGWNNGLVIADKSGNEFVWVPVDGTNVTYAKWCTEGTSYTSTSDDVEALPMKDETTRVTETEQITKYGGFYIGRYEAGVPEGGTNSNVAGTPTVQQGATVWAIDHYTNANANALAFCNTDNVKSGLVTGTQWDTVMKWIENSGINVASDSTTWGNYKDSASPANVTGYGTIKTAGYSEFWKAKNIYDLAGNTREWTGEICSIVDDWTGTIIESFSTQRGGCYSDGGSDHPASSRDGSPFIGGDDYRESFRISLYVM